MICAAYGLGIEADRPVPGLLPARAPLRVDVRVSFGQMPPWLDALRDAPQPVWYESPHRDEHGEPGLTGWSLAGGRHFRLRYRDGTEFVVDRPGSRVWATWPPALTPDDTLSYFLGPVLGFVLRLRGVVCLHASVVAAGDQALALVGHAGAGKSTTAAAFAARGHPVLSDDVAALAEQDGAFLVQPAYPRLRLSPDSVEILAAVAGPLPILSPPGTSSRYRLDLMSEGCRFQAERLPLGAVYVLGERRADPAAPVVEEVATRDALMTLVANTFATHLIDGAMRAREFAVLGRLAGVVPVRRVHPHADPRRLPRLCEAILDDFQSLGASVLSAVEGRSGT